MYAQNIKKKFHGSSWVAVMQHTDDDSGEKMKMWNYTIHWKTIFQTVPSVWV